jgi:Carboxypeptidase regulatory-like domain
MNKLLKQSAAISICIALLGLLVNAQIASSGNYTLTQTAIANGGASGISASLGGNYSIEGTIGQSAAGTNQQVAVYNFKPGFWTTQPLVPTAASVSLSGKVTTIDGSGIRNVLVTLTQSDGTTRTVLTASFGYFRFDEIEAGQIVIINVRSKRFTFIPPTLILNTTENSNEINFVANE